MRGHDSRALLTFLVLCSVGGAHAQHTGENSAADAVSIAAAQQLLSAAIGRFDNNGDGVIDIHDGVPNALLGLALRGMDRNGDGRIDVHDFLPLVRQLDVNGDGQVDLNDLPLNVRSSLAPYDTNHDGRINNEDLAGILAGLNTNADGSINLDTLPRPVRSALLAALDANRDGVLNSADMASAGVTQELLNRIRNGSVRLNDLPRNVREQLTSSLDDAMRQQVAPILSALRASPTGRAIVNAMDRDHDGRISPREVAVAWQAIESLDPSNLPLRPDGAVDLSRLPPAIRDGLAASPLDHNGDGRIDPSELQLWLSSLDQQTIDRQLLSRFDTNGDGVVDDAEILSLLPDSLAASSLRLDDLPPGVASSLLLATSAVGLGDEISASRLLAAAHALNITASASDAYAAIANALLAATRSPPPSPPHAAAPPYPLPPPPDASARLRGVAVRLYVASTPNAAEIPAFTDERGVSHHLPLRLSPMACQPFGTNYLSRGWCTADGQVHFELWSPLALAAASPPLSTCPSPDQQTTGADGTRLRPDWSARGRGCDTTFGLCPVRSGELFQWPGQTFFTKISCEVGGSTGGDAGGSSGGGSGGGSGDGSCGGAAAQRCLECRPCGCSGGSCEGRLTANGRLCIRTCAFEDCTNYRHCVAPPPAPSPPRLRPPPAPPGTATCLNTCRFASDGDCDDGGAGGEYHSCTPCTDCEDCGPRAMGSCYQPGGHAGLSPFLSPPPPTASPRAAPPSPPMPPASAGCSNSCFFASDGECDDGGAGAEFPVCTPCTDCDDCGPRDASGAAACPLSPPSVSPSSASSSPLPLSPSSSSTGAHAGGMQPPSSSHALPPHAPPLATQLAAQHIPAHPDADGGGGGGGAGWLVTLTLLTGLGMGGGGLYWRRLRTRRQGAHSADGSLSPSSTRYRSHVDDGFSAPLRMNGLSAGMVVESPLQMMELSMPATMTTGSRSGLAAHDSAAAAHDSATCAQLPQLMQAIPAASPLVTAPPPAQQPPSVSERA